MSEVIKCPKCGSQARIQGISMRTAAYYVPVYDENGVNVNPDRNITTTSWTCAKCGENYTTKTILGELIE